MRRDAISLMQLTIASESKMVQKAKRLIEQVQQQITVLAKKEIIDGFLAYGISIEEVAQLLNLTIQQVRLASGQKSSTST
ncbi:aspartate aminotransferase [Nostoc sp.]|uniref:aspartate aminotransferase n=1 Tax=Nostoc sp. TaxID=1180 RepID=UPI002FFCFCB6